MEKTIFIDDTDGKEGASRISFGLDGETFEIDLRQPNEKKLREVLAPYIEAGRRVQVPRGVRQGRQASNGRVSRAPEIDTTAIREWAAQQDPPIVMKSRGRIPADVVAKYQAAQ